MEEARPGEPAAGLRVVGGDAGREVAVDVDAELRGRPKMESVVLGSERSRRRGEGDAVVVVMGLSMCVREMVVRLCKGYSQSYTVPPSTSASARW